MGETIYDGTIGFPGGVDTGIHPYLLDKTTLGGGVNISLSGLLPHPRPPYNQLVLDDSTISGGFNAGVAGSRFQFGVYYKPDAGSEQIIVQIGGRTYLFTPSPTDSNAATVQDITIPGDANPASAVQAWLLQAENYVVIQDGQSTPLIYDGATLRRSRTAVTVGTKDASGAVANPVVGGTATIVLTAPYAGDYYIAVNVYHGAVNIGQYEIRPNAPAGNAVLTNVDDTPGGTVTAGTSIVSRLTTTGPVFVGIVVEGSNKTINTNPKNIKTSSLIADDPNYPSDPSNPGRVLTFPEGNGLAVAGFGITGGGPAALNVITSGSSFVVHPGDTIYQTQTTTTETTIGTVGTNFTVPSVGAPVTVTLDTPYAGPNGETVFINNKEYTISQYTPASSATVDLYNQTSNNTTYPSILDGALIKTVPELPVARMGAYGLGRIWFSLPDGRTFMASDIVGLRSSGTPANNYRDAVLHVNQSYYLTGGTFPLPGSIGNITAMIFPANLDTSLGQGPLQVFTPTVVFSVNAPILDMEWQNQTNPILTQSLVMNGALGHYSTINLNSDVAFRAIDGLRRLIISKRQFTDDAGNTPMSHEVTEIIDAEDTSLMQWSSAVVFGNRLLEAATPSNSTHGVIWTNIISQNLDPLSSLRGRTPASYEGWWDGLNVLQLITGLFNGRQRAFAFCQGTYVDGAGTTQPTITLVELIKEGQGTFDNGTDSITQTIDQPVMIWKDAKRLKDYIRLIDGELQLDKISGTVTVAVYFRADQDSTWHHWITQTIPGSFGLSYIPRLGLGQPPTGGDPISKKPYREGYAMQARVVITGQAELMSCQLGAIVIPQPATAGVYFKP